MKVYVRAYPFVYKKDIVTPSETLAWALKGVDKIQWTAHKPASRSLAWIYEFNIDDSLPAAVKARAQEELSGIMGVFNSSVVNEAQVINQLENDNNAEIETNAGGFLQIKFGAEGRPFPKP